MPVPFQPVDPTAAGAALDRTHAVLVEVEAEVSEAEAREGRLNAAQADRDRQLAAKYGLDKH
jgi:hypothetical protein